MGNRFPWNDAEFQHLLQRYRNTYRLPESGEDVERHYQQIIEHVDTLIRGTATDLDTDTPVYRLLQRFRDTSERKIPGSHLRVYGEVLDYITDRCRFARLDEHKLLAGLDDEGKKQRYLELSDE